MKNIDLNKVEDLVKVKESLLNIFDGRINEAKLNEAIDNIDTLSFIECKQLFEGVSDKLFNTKEGKKVIKNYANIIKENEDLKNFYYLCENLTSKKPIYEAELYVNECGTFAKKLDKATNEKFHSVIKEAIKLSGLNSDEITTILEENKDLNNSINFILTNKKTPSNLNEYVKHVSLISETLNKNTEQVIEDTVEEVNETSDLSSLLESENLAQWEKDVIEEIALCKLRGSDKSSIFENYKMDCLALIDENLENTDSLETSSRLNAMKTQLSERVYNEENANEDILRLAELKKTLSET